MSAAMELGILKSDRKLLFFCGQLGGEKKLSPIPFLTAKIILNRPCFYCQAENPGRNCTLEAVRDESWSRMRSKGRTCPVLQAIMSLAHNGSIEHVNGSL